MDIYEELKDPKKAQPFWMLSKEKQDILREAGPKNTLIVHRLAPEGRAYSSNGDEMGDGIFILKPDYHPSPRKKINTAALVLSFIILVLLIILALREML